MHCVPSNTASCSSGISTSFRYLIVMLKLQLLWPWLQQYGTHCYTTLKHHSHPDLQVSSTLNLYIQTAENYSSPINICNILYQLSI